MHKINVLKKSSHHRFSDFLVAFLLLFSTATWGQSQSQTFTPASASPWTVPAGVVTVQVEAWSGGGGSGGIGNTVTAGGQGGQTVFSTISINGGGGSQGAANNTPTGGGAGGTATGGDLNTGGTAGTTGTTGQPAYGGDGGASPNGGATQPGAVTGLNAEPQPGVNGNAPGGGAGGAARDGNNASLRRSTGGGGGSGYAQLTALSVTPGETISFTVGTGGNAGTGDAANGGDGADGQIIITYCIPTISCITSQTRSTVPGFCVHTVTGTEFDPTVGGGCTGTTTSWELTGQTTGSGNTTLAGVAFNKGITTVTWTATASDGNFAACSFTVTVNDTEDPTITMLGDATVNICFGENYIDAGATASDNCDGDLTASITTNNPVNPLIPGNYTVTYNVSDAAGNAAATVSRTVIVNECSQLIDIAIRELGCGGFEVLLRPAVDLIDNTLTNVQFTVQYPAQVSLLNLSPQYGFQPGLTIDPADDFKYITYVAELILDPEHPEYYPNTGWMAGQEYAVLTFNHDQGSTTLTTGDFIIWPGSHFAFEFYAEIAGSDATGVIYENATGVTLDGCPVHNTTKEYPAGSGTYSLFYYTVQEAISGISGPGELPGADAYDVIEAATGNYNETINIDITGLTLQPKAGELPVIDGSASAEPVVTVSANEVNLRCLTIQNSGMYTDNAGILLDNVNNCEITGNNITGITAGKGIILHGASYNLVQYNNITASQTGVMLLAAGTDASANNLINENNISNNTLNLDASQNLGEETDATCNWWGEATLSYIAAHITGTATYQPYLITDDQLDPLPAGACATGFYPAGPCQYGLTLKMLLQGAYLGSGLMRTTLNAAGQLPATQPFVDSPWGYNGTETLPDPLPAGVVDWVLVELRDTDAASGYVVQGRHAALLYDDGTVMTDLLIPSSSSSYIVVYHRNHMPVMSVAPVTSDYEFPYDFTVLENLYGYTNTPNKPAMQVLVADNPEPDPDEYAWAMIAGYVTPDGKLNYTGPGNDRGPILSRITLLNGNPSISGFVTGGYWIEDVNLNNEVRYIGEANDRAVIITNLGVLTATNFLSAEYFSLVPGEYTTAKNAWQPNGPISVSIEGLKVNITTGEPIVNGLIDNIQFTLAWETGDKVVENILNSFTSGFNLLPQGAPVVIGGISHQVFVSVTPVYLPAQWNLDEPVTVMSFDNHIPPGRLWIANNEYTRSHNAMYYVSVWGKDRTGGIKVSGTGTGDLPVKAGMRLYPNPNAGDKLYIEVPAAENQLMQVHVFNVQGSLLINTTGVFETGAAEVDISGLDPAVYIIKVHNETGVFTSRFIVVR